jgi:hypothetical protein
MKTHGAQSRIGQGRAVTAPPWPENARGKKPDAAGIGFRVGGPVGVLTALTEEFVAGSRDLPIFRQLAKRAPSDRDFPKILWQFKRTAATIVRVSSVHQDRSKVTLLPGRGGRARSIERYMLPAEHSCGPCPLLDSKCRLNSSGRRLRPTLGNGPSRRLAS